MKILESIKEHPYIAAGGVFALGIVLIIILFSGGSKPAAAVATPQSDTSAATQFAMAQLQSQTALGVANLQNAKSANDNATTIQAMQIQAATTQNHDLQQYKTVVDSALIQKDAAIGVSTIQANYMSHASDNALTASLAQTAAAKAVGLSQVDAQRSIGLASVSAGLQASIHHDDTAVNIAGIQYSQALNLQSMQDETQKRLANIDQATVFGLASMGNGYGLRSPALTAYLSGRG